MQRIAPTFLDIGNDDLPRLAQAAGNAVSWLWQGYLARGNVSLLTGQWKCGKTTLLAALLARLNTGGPLAGLPVAPSKAVVVSDETPQHWHRRAQTFNFGPSLRWLCQPFANQPRFDEWSALIEHLAGFRTAHGSDLAVIDSLASFLPAGSENHAGRMLECLAPLRQLTRQGMAVLLLHHPAKKADTPGRLARGSGALPASMDIAIEMDWHADPTEPDHRRRLRAFSRHAETPRQQVIEWNAEGTDYRSLGNLAEAEFAERWHLLRAIFASAERKLTRRAVMARWHAAEAKPDSTTLWRWLDRAVSQALLLRGGAGRKNDPYCFWLPEKDGIFNETREEFFARLAREEEEKGAGGGRRGRGPE